MKKLFFIILLIPSLAWSANPIPTSLTGDVAHGGTATIGGSNFGTKSPVAPKFWDPVDGNYASIVNGAVVPVGHPTYPWNEYGGAVPVHFKTTNPRGKFTAKYTNTGSSDGAGKAILDTPYTWDPDARYIYASWWMWQNNRDACNGSNKWNRFMDNDTWNSLTTVSFVWEPDKVSLKDYNLPQVLGEGYVVWWGPDICRGTSTWKRMEEYVDTRNFPAAPSIYIAADNVAKYSTPRTLPFATTKPVNFPTAIGFDASNTQPEGVVTVDWGEIYLDDTPARVEICNSSVKSSATHCEVQIPQNTWNDSSIQIEVNQGSFPDNSGAYLFVYNSSREVNTTGLAITFGEEVADTTAPTVTGTSPANSATGISLNYTNIISFSEGLDCSTVDTGSVTMSPNTISSVSCSGSSVTIYTTGQSATTYTVTLDTTISDDASTPNYLASNYVYSYTTVASGGTEECSYDNWHLCTTEAAALAVDIYFWEGASRTVVEPQWQGVSTFEGYDNLASPWSGATPDGWSTYTSATADATGASLTNGQQIYYPNALVEGKTYWYALNVNPGMVGQIELYKWNDSIYFDTAGTKVGFITVPESGVSDHGFYLAAPTGTNSAIINFPVLKEYAPYRPISILSTGTPISIRPWNEAGPAATPISIRGN